MAKKQKSFSDKASGNKETDAVYVKYVKSVKSEKTGRWRFNEQMIRTKKGEQLDVALKRLDQVANLVDIDLSEFIVTDTPVEETLEETPTDNAENTSNETTDQESNTEEGISESEVKEQDIAKDPEPSATSEPSDTEGSSKEE